MTEAKLARIWEDLLGVSDIAVRRPLRPLGGHSLKATQLVARIQKEFDTRVSLQDVFRVPDHRGAWRRWSKPARAAALRASNRRRRPRTTPPLIHRRRLWVIEQMGLAGVAYHIEGATGLEGAIDESALEGAVRRSDRTARSPANHVRRSRRRAATESCTPRWTNHLPSSTSAGVTDPDAEARARIRVAHPRYAIRSHRRPAVRATLYRLSPHRADPRPDHAPHRQRRLVDGHHRARVAGRLRASA